jgi:ABC-type nitrate/sulfonate/bicarbonate transport system substrate-binding protein
MRLRLRTMISGAFAFAYLCALPASAQQLTPLKVGVSDAVNTALPLWMAETGGFYAAQGLKVEIINMGGGSRGAQELQAGRLDLMRVGLSSVVLANRTGGDLRLVASMSNVIRFVVVAAPGVRTPADLKGGVVGVSTFGSESDSTISIALERWGLTRRDIIVKEYGGGSRRLAAVKSGEIKATAINEPTTSQARAQGVHVMLDLAAEQIPWLFSGVVVRRSDLAKPDTILRFLRAAIEGNHLALTNPSLAKDVLARELKLADRKIVDISYEDFRAQSPPNMEPAMKGAENVLAHISGTGSHNVADYMDLTLIDTLRSTGFFAAMAQKYGKQ